jgi:hypothetical protein
MERLLSEEDFRFLANQPGFDKKMLRRIRSERRRVFRAYLVCLNRDFSLVGAALRLMMMYSTHDRPDLAGILYKQQALFALGMLAVQWRLFLHAYSLQRPRRPLARDILHSFFKTSLASLNFPNSFSA